MSAIAATGSSSGYSAVAQLLANSLSSAASGNPLTGQSSNLGSSATPTSGPSDSLNLSDHAKAVLARAQTDQIAAGELQTFLQSARNPNGTGTPPASKPASDNVTQIFDQLTGQTQSQQPPQQDPANLSLAGFEQVDGTLGGLAAYARSLDNAREGADGTLTSFSQTLQDVVVAAPSTQQQIEAWYQGADGQEVSGAAQYWPDNDPGLAEALASHAVTFLNASDVPGLNFHNTVMLQEGEGGGSEGQTYNYNLNAAIFSDPTTSYKVLAGGTVLSWKTPPATGTTASN
jgi:hypothetical protein